MTKDKNKDYLNYDYLLTRIQSLEKRLSGIEKMLRVEWNEKTAANDIESIKEISNRSNNTESNIVEYGLPWLGSIVLIFAIIFLMNYTEGLGYLGLSRGFAYISTFILIGIAYYLRHSFPILVYVLNICGVLLLYYITMRLHFFSELPIISQKGIGIFLLLVVVGLQLFKSIRETSEFQASIAVLLGTITAIISDSTYATLSIALLISISGLYLFYRYNWWRLLIFCLFITYITQLIWLFSNPFMGHQLKVVANHENSILFLFAQGIIYSLPVFISIEKLKSNGALISITIWNALLFSVFLLLMTISFYEENYKWIFSAITLFCIIYAVLLKVKEKSGFAPATYACFGFLAGSVAIYGFVGLPDSYFLLVLQSLLVVTMALWFRSQIIVVANSILFVSILIIYLATSPPANSINFGFAAIALVTARILNWKKERLTLKTEVFRNIYLIIVLFMVLFGLSHALPSQYVTLSWTAAAIFFFVLSILLKRIKYRWMSILTIIITGGHLFFIDLSQMEVGYRVVAFLVFAVISLGVSLYYTKRIHKK